MSGPGRRQHDSPGPRDACQCFPIQCSPDLGAGLAAGGASGRHGFEIIGKGPWNGGNSERQCVPRNRVDRSSRVGPWP